MLFICCGWVVCGVRSWFEIFIVDASIFVVEFF